jgi:hypothetical protein
MGAEEKEMRTNTRSKEATRPGIRIAGKSYSLAAPAGTGSGQKRALPKGSDCTKIAAARSATR